MIINLESSEREIRKSKNRKVQQIYNCCSILKKSIVSMLLSVEFHSPEQELIFLHPHQSQMKLLLSLNNNNPLCPVNAISLNTFSSLRIDFVRHLFWTFSFIKILNFHEKTFFSNIFLTNNILKTYNWKKRLLLITEMNQKILFVKHLLSVFEYSSADYLPHTSVDNTDDNIS